jgi:hypothetical protein
MCRDKLFKRMVWRKYAEIPVEGHGEGTVALIVEEEWERRMGGMEEGMERNALWEVTWVEICTEVKEGEEVWYG